MEQEDQLSNLPKIILHEILSRLPKKDVARTSVLSKAWLETWYTFPNLSFCDSRFIGKSSIQSMEHIVGTFPQPMDDLSKKKKDFIDYVKSTLLRFFKQRLAIKKFKLSVNCFDLGYISKDVDLFLKLASESGVEVLKLCNGPNKDDEERGECYVLPKSVIEAKSLTKLVLIGKIRVDQAFMNHSIKFFSLRELYLSNVHLEDEQAIEYLISYCPLIELITLIFNGGMKSLRMHALQKLKTVHIRGIKELNIDEAPSLENLNYYCRYLDTTFKIESIQSENLKELELSLNRTTIITNKWFFELFLKFRFLEKLDLWNCTTSKKINISSVQLKFLKLSRCFNLKEAHIDAPNLLSCYTTYDSFRIQKPIISFLRISSQLKVNVVIDIDYFDVCYVREVLQNIKLQNVLTSLTIFFKPTVDVPNPMLLDIRSPPRRIEVLDLYFVPENESLVSDLVVSLLLCCIPTTISLNLNFTNRAFIEILYKTLMRRKDDVCFCSSRDTKCWWHDLKDVKVTSYLSDKIYVDFKTVLESFPTFKPRYISFKLQF